MFTDEQIQHLITQYQKAGEMLRSTAKSLNQATQIISKQRSTIERLSVDNLQLVARLDALTGKTAPDTTFSA
jgi:uncharacterized protein YaaN involved in tellurite resistance